ncbi:MAG: metallophosphoesterase [Candidatus Rhabdochlamydia sp.]
MNTPFRIAHLSDLHFADGKMKMSHLSCKTVLGKLNFYLNRNRKIHYPKLQPLPELLASLQVNGVIITGDVSTTSSEEEFQRAKIYINQLTSLGISVYCIPGNHDCYTKQAHQDALFYKFFDASWDPQFPYSLQLDGVTLKKLCPKWWILGLDTAEPTSLFQSTGRVRPETLRTLNTLFTHIPSQDHMIMINHFPFLQEGSGHRQLIHRESLLQLFYQHPQIQLYCHGHTHHRLLTDLREDHLPIVLDAGSITQKDQGGWSLIDLLPHSLQIQHYDWVSNQWLGQSRKSYDMV